ncbi:globoside alpha-1,3-N-acetylgalactosaminyltransferase 1 [Labeo rohita]|uniref:globoside alpha-1,3-N-acetylgalactosaminyltransferase 1 n=1 Tax=Labeo rohita TaxID=84645 RepID=UPI0021E3032F|nr:globoside alpha-1,3-N-acetylgalactosaminyltransferase 1 [Labeo rohita]
MGKPGIMLLHQNFLIILVLSGMVLSGLIYLNINWYSCSHQITEQGFIKPKWKQKTVGLRSSPGLVYNQPSALVGRTDVASVTPWSAPIIWEGTFDPTLIDSIYKQQNLTIATTVFALGKYTRFIKDFLESAEQHYLVGFRVHYYLFTDQPESVPEVKMGENRSLTVLTVQSLNRWQDISMNRMEKLEKLIENELVREADYIFCLDIDGKFYGRWGAESLGRLVGVIHPWFYNFQRNQFTYERRPESLAYIPAGEGDYYYAGAAFGGTLEDVLNLTKTCREHLNIDAANSIEALWQEESHLNKYFLLNKPSKLLSPEYMWRGINIGAAQIKIVRLANVPKNYAEVRPNP